MYIYPYFNTNAFTLNFKRDISNRLDEWKNSLNRKPLILRGARQVGKTTLVNDFSKTFKNSIQTLKNRGICGFLMIIVT